MYDYASNKTDPLLFIMTSHIQCFMSVVPVQHMCTILV